MNVKEKEKELQTRIEERIRIANQLRMVADAMLTAPEGKTWDGYWGAVFTEKMYAIRYKERTTAVEWTFEQAVKFMRAIPVNDSIQMIDDQGRVHFTLPSRKP